MNDTDDYMLRIIPIEHTPLHYNIYGENRNIIFYYKCKSICDEFLLFGPKKRRKTFFSKMLPALVFTLVVTGTVWYNDRKPICENVFANILKVLREEHRPMSDILKHNDDRNRNNHDHAVTKADMSMTESILPYSFGADVPLEFTYNGVRYKGLKGNPDITDVTEEYRIIDSNTSLTTVKAKIGGLEITAEHTGYFDFPANEWVAYFKNVSDRKSGILSEVFISGELMIERAVLRYSNGDTQINTGYEFFEDDLQKPFTLEPDDSGNSCCGAAPYMRLYSDDAFVNIAVGWTGMWTAVFERKEGSVFAKFGQKRCHMSLLPGETIRTPRVVLEGGRGSEEHARNLWRRFFMSHVLIKDKDGSSLGPKLAVHVMNVDGRSESSGATEENQIRGIDSYLKNGLHPDIWWIDAGWYPCGYDWTKTGSWYPNPETFPNGLSPVGRKCRENGILFLLWFEPERVRRGTWISDNHPEWLLSVNEDDDHRLLDLSRKDVQDWLIDHVDSLIKESMVDIYRQDFNFKPMPMWIKNEAPDRIGALENLHIQGYYRYWDELKRRNPGLIIDSCASGGRRNDIETMKRSVPFHYTDVEYGVHPVKQKQHRFMFEWIPYFRAHNMSWDDENGDYYTGNPAVASGDDFSYQCAFAPAITDMIEWNADAERFKRANRILPVWRKAAKMMLEGDYYPLTKCRKSPEDFYAMEFYNPREKKGFFQVVANTHVKEDGFTAGVVLDENEKYRLENGLTGEVSVVSGKDLTAGFRVELKPRSGIVYFFETVK